MVQEAHLQQESGHIAVCGVLAVVVAELLAHALQRSIVRELARVRRYAVDPCVANLQQCKQHDLQLAGQHVDRQMDA